MLFEDFVHYDDDVAVCATLDDEDIVAEVVGQAEEGESSSEDGAELPQPLPKFSDAVRATETVKRYVYSKEVSEEQFPVVTKCESLMYDLEILSKKTI